MSDIPAPLVFVDPKTAANAYRVCLWNAPGTGKSVAAASAPTPILVVSADRPTAYAYARKHHGHDEQQLREVRYEGPETLQSVVTYLGSEGCDVRTVVFDPISHIVDRFADIAPRVPESEGGGPNYQWVNKQIMTFLLSLRRYDVNVVLVAHERLSEGKKGDGKLYPQIGGPALINKVLAEMDIVARIERVTRTVDDADETVWVGQLQPVGNLVCKEATAADLGDRRVADLSRWFELANAAVAPDNSDLPFELDPDAVDVEDDAADVVDQGTLDDEAAAA